MSKNIKIEKLKVAAKSGRNLRDCIPECIALSFEKNTIVTLYHNNSKFTINSEAITRNILKSEKKSERMD